MGSCVMMFKPSGGTLFKLRGNKPSLTIYRVAMLWCATGMRFDLIRSHLIKYGIIINQKFIKQVPIHCICRQNHEGVCAAGAESVSAVCASTLC